MKIKLDRWKSEKMDVPERIFRDPDRSGTFGRPHGARIRTSCGFFYPNSTAATNFSPVSIAFLFEQFRFLSIFWFCFDYYYYYHFLVFLFFLGFWGCYYFSKSIGGSSLDPDSFCACFE